MVHLAILGKTGDGIIILEYYCYLRHQSLH